MKAWLKVINHDKRYSNLRLLKTVGTCVLLCLEDTFIQLYQKLLKQKCEQKHRLFCKRVINTTPDTNVMNVSYLG